MPIVESHGNHYGRKTEVHDLSAGTAADNYVPASQADGTAGWEAQAGGGGGGTPGGSDTQVQYNNAGSFGGITGATTNGTALVLVAPLLGTPASGVLTNCTGLPTAGHVDDSVTYAKMQNVSATDKVLGRSTAGAGDPEEIAFTAAMRALADDATAADMLNTLGAAAKYTHPPLVPCSQQPDTSGQVYDNVHLDGSVPFVGMGVVGSATLSANRTWYLQFMLPPVLPAGTCKLLLISVGAIAGSHAYKINPKWVCIATTERVSKARSAEGTQTVNVTTSEANDHVVTKVTLAATTLVAGTTLALDLVFEDSGYTVTVVSTHQAFIIWEA